LTFPFARNTTVGFSGVLPWLIWRGIYLSKLRGIAAKLRVLMRWTIELFFPRDIVQTIDLEQEKTFHGDKIFSDTVGAGTESSKLG